MTICQDGARKFMDIVMPMVSMHLERDGYLLPVAFMLVRRSPETGERLDKLTFTISPLPWRNQAEKLYMTDQIKRVAKTHEAEMVILATEVWYADGLTPEQVKEADAYVRKHGSMEGFPGVKERVLIRLEYGTCAEFWEAPIERVEGHPHVGAFEHTESLATAILHTVVDNSRLTN